MAELLRLAWSRLPLKLRHPFRTAKALREHRQSLWVRLSYQGLVGWGEAAPVETYQQTIESAEAALAEMEPLLGDDPLDVEGISERLLARFDDQRAAVAAVDAAVHDWIGRRFGVPVVRWLGLNPGAAPLTSFTIGIDEPELIARKVREAESYPILKVKLGTADDRRILSVIREIAPDKRLRVDANAAWSVEQAMEKLPMLAELGVEFVEQPLAPGDLAGLRALRRAGILPIVADESCVRPADVAAVADCVDGINIKLSKCGGIRPALNMVRVARSCGLKVMLGCMIESSLGIAAAAQLAPLADWLDLDGHLLLADDPFTGLGGEGGRLSIGAGPGLGVRPTRASGHLVG